VRSTNLRCPNALLNTLVNIEQALALQDEVSVGLPPSALLLLLPPSAAGCTAGLLARRLLLLALCALVRRLTRSLPGAQLGRGDRQALAQLSISLCLCTLLILLHVFLLLCNFIPFPHGCILLQQILDTLWLGGHIA
jgi:hypothetical protein